MHVAGQQRVHEALVLALGLLPVGHLTAIISDIFTAPFALPFVAPGVDNQDLYAGRLKLLDSLRVALRREWRIQVADHELIGLLVLVDENVAVQAAALVLGIQQADLTGIAFRHAPGHLERREGLAGA
ncbi:hypothetical protein D3C84_560910 [compost metagenome]